MRTRLFSRVRRARRVAHTFLPYFPRIFDAVKRPFALPVTVLLFLGVIAWRVPARGMGVIDREIVREAAQHVCDGKSRESGCGAKVQ